MASLKFRIIIEKDDAKSSVAEVEAQVDDLKEKAETPSKVKFDAQGALATIRDVMFNLQSLKSLVSGIVNQANDFLNSSLQQKQAVTLTNIAFKSQSEEMQKLASHLQSLTNHGDELLLPLMSKMRQTFKLTTDEVKAITPYILDFADANASTGMTVTAAFSLMGRAVNGYTDSLREYGVELDKNRLNQEGISYLIEKLANDYGGVSEALVDLRTQNSNTWGDIKEQIGDMLNVLVTPLLKGLKSLFDWYQKLTPTVKGFVTGLAIAVPIIGTVTTAITILTAAVIALKTAINPVVGIISLVVTALVTAGFGYASYKLSVDSAKNAQTTFNDELQTSEEKLQSLIIANRQFANSLDYSEAKNQLKSVSSEIDELLSKYNANRDTKILFIPDQEDIDKLNELYVKEGTLKERIRVDDLKAQKKWQNEKAIIDKKASLTAIELTAYQLSEAKKTYDKLGELDAENYDKKMEVYSKIIELESKLSQQAETETNKQILLQQKYTILAIEDTIERQIKQLEIERDSELKKAEAMNASEKTLQNIKKHYANEEERIRQEYQSQKEAEQEQEKAKEEQHQEEMEAIREEFRSKSNELAVKTYDVELSAVDAYYERKRGKLLEAGLSEEQITKQTEAAKQRIRESYQQKAAQGFSGMFGNIAKAAQAFGKKGFKVWKAMSMAQALVDTYSSATAAYKAMVGLPVIGPGLAIAAAAAAMAAGMANVSMISKQKYQEAEDGGLMKGPSHSQGGFLINMEGDEYITRKARVRQLGAKFFDFINYAPIDKVRQIVGGAMIPNIPMASAPAFSYASGGQVSGSNGLAVLISKVDDLISENISLRRTLQNKSMTVVNQISANEIIENADATLISEKSDSGSLIRSNI